MSEEENLNTNVVHSTETISGSQGDPSCTHKWLTTTRTTEDEVTREVSKSSQCVECGKQYAIINTWETVELELDEETEEEDDENIDEED